MGSIDSNSRKTKLLLGDNSDVYVIDVDHGEIVVMMT